MKTFKLSLFSLLFILIAQIGFAQTTSQSFKVLGECGSCKKHIEKAAKEAGAIYADWNQTSKILTVKYTTTASTATKIQQSIASAGYDTPDYKATDEAYNKLDECCQYDRTAATASVSTNCCDTAKCTNAECAKGNCSKDMSCCKNDTCTKEDCCKKS